MSKAIRMASLEFLSCSVVMNCERNWPFAVWGCAVVEGIPCSGLPSELDVVYQPPVIVIGVGGDAM